MVKRRYGVISENGKFIASSNTDIINNCLTKSGKSIDEFVKAYNEAFDYSCSLNANVVFGLKNNKSICVWEMGNKNSTYKEFVI